MVSGAAGIQRRPDHPGRRLRPSPLFAPPRLLSGSHTQCGCGFSSREEPEVADRRRSLEGLQAYLADATLRRSVELFVCWDGDYAEDPRQRIQLQAKELAGRDDWLEERTFVEVRRAAA